MNLYEIINNLYRNDKNYWDYYEGITVDPVSNPSEAYRFINEFFRLGSKGDIFHNVFDENENTTLVIRYDSHTIKVFFIGIFLQKILDRDLSIKSELGANYPFGYL